MGEGDARHEAGGQSAAAAAGWYPDPNGGAKLRYWDGASWTDHFHPPDPPTLTEKAKVVATPSRLVIGGAAALGISPFLPWLKVFLLGNLNLFQMFEIADRSTAWAWIAVLTGAISAIVVFRDRSRSKVRGFGLVVGLLGGALAAYALISLRSQISDANGLVTVAIGPYVAVAGCIAMIVGGWMAKE